MADFKIAYKKTHGNEVGFSLVREDRGNWTGGQVDKGTLAGTINGITCWEVEAYLGRPVTAKDVKNFPLAAQKEIYKKKYWDVMKGDQIKDQDYANDIYDFGVNVGIHTGIAQWQRTVGLEETGNVDKVTLTFLNKNYA